MNVFWYTAKFDEASWKFLSLVGIHPGYLRDSGRRMAAARQPISYVKEAPGLVVQAVSMDHREPPRPRDVVHFQRAVALQGITGRGGR